MFVSTNIKNMHIFNINFIYLYLIFLGTTIFCLPKLQIKFFQQLMSFPNFLQFHEFTIHKLYYIFIIQYTFFLFSNLSCNLAINKSFLSNVSFDCTDVLLSLLETYVFGCSCLISIPVIHSFITKFIWTSSSIFLYLFKNFKMFSGGRNYTNKIFN